MHREAFLSAINKHRKSMNTSSEEILNGFAAGASHLYQVVVDGYPTVQGKYTVYIANASRSDTTRPEVIIFSEVGRDYTSSDGWTRLQTGLGKIALPELGNAGARPLFTNERLGFTAPILPWEK